MCNKIRKNSKNLVAQYVWYRFYCKIALGLAQINAGNKRDAVAVRKEFGLGYPIIPINWRVSCLSAQAPKPWFYKNTKLDGIKAIGAPWACAKKTSGPV